MPIVGDFIKTTFVQELSGVQMSNVGYWRVDDLGAEPPLSIALGEILTAYHVAVRQTQSPAWAIVCALYENLSRPEGMATIFDNLTGTGVVDSHPQMQVVRLNRQTVPVAPATISVRTAGWHQSGVIESLSTRGRVNDVAEFINLRNFLGTQQDFNPNWAITPVMRVRESKANPLVFHFPLTQQVSVQRTFLSLRSRKTSLCVA